MDILTQLQTYIKPELLIIVPVLYLLGIGMKKSESIKDNRIPVLLGLFGVILAVLWIAATTTYSSWKDCVIVLFSALTQGVLLAGCSTYINQIIKQSGKDE